MKKKTMIMLIIFIILLACSVDAAGKSRYIKYVTMNAGTSRRLKLKNTKGSIKWYSSNKRIVSVSSGGRIYARRTGNAKITARYKGRRYRFIVRVVCRVQKVTLPKGILIQDGNAVRLKAVLIPKKATDRSLVWKTSDPKVAQVDDNGVVTPVGEGSCKITVQALSGKKKYAATTVIVKNNNLSETETELSDTGEIKETEAAYDPETEEIEADKHVCFNLKYFPETVTLTGTGKGEAGVSEGSVTLAVIPDRPVDPDDITFVVNHGEADQIKNFIERSASISEYGFKKGFAAYVPEWKDRIAYVECGYNPSTYFKYRVDIYPAISTGHFTVEARYLGERIASCDVYVAGTDGRSMELEAFVKRSVEASFNEASDTAGKLDALQKYMESSYEYTELDCKRGAQVMFCAAKNLGLEVCYGYELSPVKCYEIGSVAVPGGHTWCEINIDGQIHRYDVQGRKGTIVK